MICFDVASLYYLPQYLPVAKELRMRGVAVTFILRADDDKLMSVAAEALAAADFTCVRLRGNAQTLAWYQARSPAWIIFGNDCPFLADLPKHVRTALLYHGIGVKSCYYDEVLSRFDVRFTEGDFRTRQLQQLYPGRTFVDVGFAKLDPLLGGELQSDSIDLNALGLDASKPTVLYAPTFYPSSIECLSKRWPESLADVNLLVKPHMLTWSSEKYKKQQAVLRAWQSYAHVHVAEVSDFSLLPYMAVSDVLVSEASSAIFEFAALDKPIVWCDFYRLRWSYRGVFKYRHERRMDQTIRNFQDVGAHAAQATDLTRVVRQELSDPHRHAAGRKRCTRELIGMTDGHTSRRVADHLLS